MTGQKRVASGTLSLCGLTERATFFKRNKSEKRRKKCLIVDTSNVKVAYHMLKSLLISIACLVFVLKAVAQQAATYESADELQREITSLLLERDINEVIKQLESENPSTVAPLLAG
jgi:hypothetical protein